VGEIGRAHDRVFEAIPGELDEHDHGMVYEALGGVYQVGYRHGEADYEEKHADDEPEWVAGARALVKARPTDFELLGRYVKAFLCAL
jgi:hypothetical protein